MKQWMLVGMCLAAATAGAVMEASGTGQDSNAQNFGSYVFKPGECYELSFLLRSDAASDGVLTAGPGFANMDFSHPTAHWQEKRVIFIAPLDAAGYQPLHFGQWHFNGKAFFDRPAITKAVPIYAHVGALTLGAGEELDGTNYSFQTRFDSECGLVSRPLAGYRRASFNTSRWCLSEGSEVVYRHELAGCVWQAGTVELACRYYVRGQARIEASADGQVWSPVGLVTTNSIFPFPLPAALFPAKALYLRLQGEGQGCSLQINDYSLKATVNADEPGRRIGSTRYFEIPAEDPQLKVEILDCGECLPCAESQMRLKLSAASHVSLRLLSPTGAVAFAETRAAKAGEISIPYKIPDTGEWTLELAAGAWRGKCRFSIPNYYTSSYGESLPAAQTDFRLWRASSGWKIPPVRAIPSRKADGLRVSLARNERESTQLVIVPAHNLKDVKVEASDLVSGTNRIPARELSIARVGYVHVAQPTDACGLIGEWPDPLLPQAGPLAAPAGRNCPFWITVHAPKGTPPGRYRGSLTVTAGNARDSVALEAEVFAFELPDTMTCEASFGFSSGEVFRRHALATPEQRQAVLDRYLALLAEHHLSPYNPAPLASWSVDWKGDEPTFHWEAWDRAMEDAFARYHFGPFVIHVAGLGGGTYASRTEPSFRGAAGGTPAYECLMDRYLKGIETHLRTKGWLDQAYVYWFDEPETKDYPFVMKGFETLKRHAPGLRRMLTEEPSEGLLGGPNLWCPLTPNLHSAGEAACRAAGDRFWWYVCCGPRAPYVTEFIDHPGSEMRLWLWQTWGEKVAGILIWETVWWTSSTAYPNPWKPQNPYLDPMSWVADSKFPAGTRQAWGNGDGRFLYPPLAAADGRAAAPVLEGPNSCIRLDMLRDGLEDYEYFAILKRLLAQKPAGQPEETLLAVPKDVYTTLTAFTVDPAPMEAHRERLARAIERLVKVRNE